MSSTLGELEDELNPAENGADTNVLAGLQMAHADLKVLLKQVIQQDGCFKMHHYNSI